MIKTPTNKQLKEGHRISNQSVRRDQLLYLPTAPLGSHYSVLSHCSPLKLSFNRVYMVYTVYGCLLKAGIRRKSDQTVILDKQLILSEAAVELIRF